MILFYILSKNFHICNKRYQNFCYPNIIGVLRYFHFFFFFFGTSFRIFNKRIISSNPIIILFVFGCSDHWLRWTSRRILDSFGGQFALLQVNIGFQVVKSLSSWYELIYFSQFLSFGIFASLPFINFSCEFIFYCSLWVTSGYAAGCYS